VHGQEPQRGVLITFAYLSRQQENPLRWWR
jgi:hypothetical protein